MPGITVDFNANLAQLLSDINRANQQLSQFGSGAERLASGISSVLKAVGVGFTFKEFFDFHKEIIDTADDLNDLSIKTKISVENLSGLALAAEQSGADLSGAASAINKLSVNIGKNAEDFAKLGITAKDPLEAFGQFADVLNAIDDPQQRAAFGAKALGKSWAEVAPLLDLGSQGLAEIIDKGRAASGITTELAQASDQFNDSLSELQASAKGAAVEGFAPLVPILNDLIDYFADTDAAAGKAAESASVLKEAYKLVAESVAVVGYGFDVAGKHLGAFIAQTNAITHLDLAGFNEIDKALKEDLSKADARLNAFFDKIENGAPKGIEVPVNPQIAAPSGNTIDVSGGNKAVTDFLKTGEDGQKILSKALRDMQTELARHLRGIESSIDEEVGQFDLRNKKLEIALDLGLVDQEDYYRQKEKLQKDQLAETEALLDQEISALRQFQSQATDEAAKSDSQEKINALIREKTKLEQDAQIATLQNAAAARQALGSYSDGLTDVNDLLQGVASNIIGLSQAQAALNMQIGGVATAEDVLSKKKIFASADGKSFSDRPTEVGITLDLSEQENAKIQDQLTQLRDQAVADSAILLGVDVDQAAAIAKITDATSAINESLANIDPVTLGMDVDQAQVIAAAQRARDAAQAAVQPVVIPVVYAAQNTPATAAAANADLTQAALAAGGR